MKKLGVLLVLVILASFIAQAEVQETDYNPRDEIAGRSGGLVTPEGETNISVFNPVKTTAEEKIENLNKQFPWLESVIGMKIELSWKFAFNLIIIIAGAYILVFILPKLNPLVSVPTLIFRIVGLLMLWIITYTKITVKFAEVIDSFTNDWKGKLVTILLLVGIVFLLLLVNNYTKIIRKARTLLIKQKEDIARSAKVASKTAREEVKKSKEKEAKQKIKVGKEEEKSMEAEVEESIEAEEEAEAIGEMAKED